MSGHRRELIRIRAELRGERGGDLQEHLDLLCWIAALGLVAHLRDQDLDGHPQPIARRGTGGWQRHVRGLTAVDDPDMFLGLQPTEATILAHAHLTILSSILKRQPQPSFGQVIQSLVVIVPASVNTELGSVGSTQISPARRVSR